MSDKKEEPKAAAKPAEKADPHAEAGGEHAAKKGGLMGKLPMLVGGVMVIEAVILFAGFKFLGGGKPTVVVGADLVKADEKPGDAKGGDAKGEGKESAKEGAKGEGKEGEGAAAGTASNCKDTELLVVEMKAPNKVSGKTFIYDVSIYAVTKTTHADEVKADLKSHEALLKDRIRTIIAQSDPEKLGGGTEPGLETLRRQVKFQLDEVVGEKMIDEVLVPRCIAFRTDY